MTADDIKAKFPLRAVAIMCGIELPRDGVKFRSPFRVDDSPSCTIKGDLITDWSREEKLDAIGFFAAAKGIENGQAFKELGKMAGANFQAHPGKVKVARPASPTARQGVTIPERIESPTRKLIEGTAEERGLSWEAFEAARVFFKTLTFGRLFDQSCWFLHDRRGLGFEARRCDNREFEPVGNLGPRKSHSKGQGVKAWPMGILPPGVSDETIKRENPRILLVEGTPDYVAACQLAMMIGPLVLPCAMLGKGADIAPDALPYFKGRAVTIAGHTDASGRIKAWGGQIKRAGAAEVKPVLLGNHRDLNDWLRYCPDRAGELLNLLHLKP